MYDPKLLVRKNEFLHLFPQNTIPEREEYAKKLRKDYKNRIFSAKRRILNELKNDFLPDYDFPIKLNTSIENLMLQNCDNEILVKSAIFIKELTFKHDQEIISKITVQNLYPVLIKLIDSEDNLSYEIIWILSNLACSNYSIAMKIYENKGHIKILEKLRFPSNLKILEASLYALASLAGNSYIIRNELLNFEVISNLIGIISKPKIKLSILRSVLWLFANICRGKPRIDLSKIICFVNKISEYELFKIQDVEFIENLVYALKNIAKCGYLGINLIMNFYANFIEIIQNEKISLEILKNILAIYKEISRDTEINIEKFMKNGAFEKIVNFVIFKISFENKEIWIKICEILINIAENYQINEIIEKNIHVKLFEIIKINSDFYLKRLIGLTILKICENGNENEISKLVQDNILEILVNLLNCQDAKIVENSLNTISEILEAGEEKIYENNTNDYAIKLDEYGGVRKIEALMQHPNLNVFKKAQSIIDTYFMFEDEEINRVNSVNFNKMI